MSNSDERDATKQGQMNRPRKLELKKTVETGQVRQSFSHGRSKMVTVEVRKKRTIAAETGRGGDGDKGRSSGGRGGSASARDLGMAGLTNREKETRARVLQDAKRAEEERVQAAQIAEERAAEQAALEAQRAREAEEAERLAEAARAAEEAAAAAAGAAAASEAAGLGRG